MQDLIYFYSDSKDKLELPFFLCPINAGFPSPAEDYLEKNLDLNDLLIKNPSSTFFVRVEGHSMRDASINTGDILVVDRSQKAASGKIIVALLNGEFTVKRFIKSTNGCYLEPANKEYESIEINENTDFQVWGVVTYVIHRAC
jgi:DNA polymerase V